MNILLKRHSPLLAFANKFVFESEAFDFDDIKNNEQRFELYLDAAKFDEDLYVACWYVAYGYDVAAYVARQRGHTISGMERSKVLHVLLARLRLETATVKVFTVGQRLLYKIDKNEWYVGTVMKLTPTKVFVKYDDGFMSKTGTAKSDADLFEFNGGATKYKKPLTDAEAKTFKSPMAKVKVPPAATLKKAVPPKRTGAPNPGARTTPRAKAPLFPPRDMSVHKGSPTEWTYDIMVQINYSNGSKWKYCHKNTRSAVYVTNGESVKIKPIDKRHVLAWRAATPEEKKANYESVQEKRAEKLSLGVEPGVMVQVNYKSYPVWEYCHRVDKYKGTFSVAGGGGKMRDLALTLALQVRPATPAEKADAEATFTGMAERRARLKNRRTPLMPWNRSDFGL